MKWQGLEKGAKAKEERGRVECVMRKEDESSTEEETRKRWSVCCVSSRERGG